MEEAGLAAFSLAITQLVKKLGVQGNWLILVCVAAGGLGNYLMTYQPAIWSGISGLLVGTTTTGGVSFFNDLLAKAKQSQNG